MNNLVRVFVQICNRCTANSAAAAAAAPTATARVGAPAGAWCTSGRLLKGSTEGASSVPTAATVSTAAGCTTMRAIATMCYSSQAYATHRNTHTQEHRPKGACMHMQEHTRACIAPPPLPAPRLCNVHLLACLPACAFMRPSCMHACMHACRTAWHACLPSRYSPLRMWPVACRVIARGSCMLANDFERNLGLKINSYLWHKD